MANIFQYGVKAANTLATATKAGLMKSDHFNWLANVMPRIRYSSNVLNLDAPSGSVVTSGKIANHMASNVQLNDSGGAWNRYDTGQPGQILVLRSSGGNNSIEYYDTPAGANPAAFSLRMALTPANFVDGFTPPRGRIRRTVAQAIANLAPTPITFDTSDGLVDNGYGGGTDFWDGGTAFFARKAGWYVFTGFGYWTPSGAGVYREISIWRNGGGYVAAGDHASPFSATFPSNMAISTIIYMNLNDYVQLQVYQHSGGALNFNGAMLHGYRFSG